MNLKVARVKFKVYQLSKMQIYYASLKKVKSIFMHSRVEKI